jgi:tRNA(Ile2) C34 agmatinyltransferase TiaS
MDKKKGDRYNKKRQDNNKEDKKKMKKNVRRCPHCGFAMRCRGASDSAGAISWKCRNKKCGRTVWERQEVKPPVPIFPVSYMDKIRM